MSTNAGTQSVRFWDRIAVRYSKKPVADEAAYQKKLQVTRGYFRPDMEVLEFGCGTGSTAITHAPYVKHIRAIDVSSKMIEIARGKADAEDVHNITFEQATIEQFTAPAQTYDAVLGLSILHLLANKEQVIARVHDMLKPGGLFVTSTVCMADTKSIFKIIIPIGSWLGVLPMVKMFSLKELKDSLIDAGFTLDYQWQPSGRSAFIVAKKAE